MCLTGMTEKIVCVRKVTVHIFKDESCYTLGGWKAPLCLCKLSNLRSQSFHWELNLSPKTQSFLTIFITKLCLLSFLELFFVFISLNDLLWLYFVLLLHLLDLNPKLFCVIILIIYYIGIFMFFPFIPIFNFKLTYLTFCL